MHSKFSKIQTVFLTLAVLFTSVLVPNQVQALESGSASNAAQAAAITDPNTFDAWYKIQGNNTSAIGRIWADKTVDADPIQFTTGPLKDQSIEKSAGLISWWLCPPCPPRLPPPRPNPSLWMW